MLDFAQRDKDFYIGKESLIFIVLDGIDRIVEEGPDGEGQQADLFWLPEYSIKTPRFRHFPESFRVVLTCRSTSANSMRLLVNRGIRCLSMPEVHNVEIKSVIGQHLTTVISVITS